MKSVHVTPAVGLALLLAACGEKAETNATATNAAAEASGAASGMANMSGNMAMPAGKPAKGTGTVTAIDRAAGTITLDHGPIAEAGWPAMTMAFKAAPGLLDSVKVGDKVSFELTLKDGSGEVTSIAKQ